MNKITLSLILLLCGSLSLVAQPKKGPKGKNAKPEPKVITIEDYYHEIPLVAFPLIQDAIKQTNASNPAYKVSDNAEYRNTFIKTNRKETGFLELQKGGDLKRTSRMQLWMDKDSTNYVAIEDTKCEGVKCNNTFQMWVGKGGTWTIDSTLVPELDYKWIYKTLKKYYKGELLDLDVFNAKGFEDNAVLRQGLVFFIDQPTKTIVIREAHFNLSLIEYTFDPNKKKFSSKKLM